ncbi:MAG: extracellular solute-binding protein, partial [Chloroflexi bacterium]|nr:extracellular solute-binding protein [Chloroflexota bacterium]
LDAAHSAGVIHRDIKPANLMLTREGRVKIVDLGIARATDPEITQVTDINAGIPATRAYAPPEQLAGDPRLTWQTDLYAVGATFYHLLSGRLPFSGVSRPDPARLEPLPPDVSPQLAAVVLRALAVEPAQRWPTASAMLAESRPFARAGFRPDLPGYTDPPLVVSAPPPELPPSPSAIQREAPSRSPGLTTVLPWLISAVSLLLVSGLLGFLLGSGLAPRPVGGTLLPAAPQPTSPLSTPTSPPATLPATSPPVAVLTTATSLPPTVAVSTPTPGGLPVPPPVPNAAQASAYSGTRLSYYGDSVGIGNDIDNAVARQFQQDTGIEVDVVPRPQSPSDTLAQYQLELQSQSAKADVLMIDVTWPGLLSPHLVDLNPKLGTDAKRHYQALVENDTVDGHLVAMPWFGDFGMLYYRTDLLQKYGINSPPRTWDDLEQQARRITDGERSTNPNLTGFVFEGNAYEGLTCVALEWLTSSGGGTIMDATGLVTVNNPKAQAMLNRARGWVGTISPRGVTSFQEEDARQAFQNGNAVFMRNWPYAFDLAQRDDSAVKGKFDVAPVPTAPGERPVGTVGGWQLAVSRYSKNQDAAIEFVRYATSPEVQTYRALVGGFVPTMPDIAAQAQVVKAEPYLTNLQDVQRVVRPARLTGAHYDQASTMIFQAVNQILNGRNAEDIVPGLQQQLEQLLHPAA